MKVIVGLVASISIVLAGCGGGGGGGGYFSSATDSTPNGFTVESGVAQKGPLMQGSQVTIDELSVWNLQPSGRSFNFEITNNLGTFNTTGINFSSPYLSTTADGYYFNELTGLPSTDTVFLRGLSYLYGRGDTVINVNVLSNFSKNRIVNLATGKNLIDPSTGAAITATPKPFLAARAQAQAENFKAAYIYNSATILSGTPLNGVVQPSYFTALDLSKNRTADQILAAASAAVMTAGQNGNGVNTLLSQIEADFADDGLLNNSPKYSQSVQTRLCAAVFSTDFAKVATNLNAFYGTNYQATDLSQWVDTSGCVDQVIEKYKYSGAGATSPQYLVGVDDVGQCFSITTGILKRNGVAVTSATVKAVGGDKFVMTLLSSNTGFIQRSAPNLSGVCPTSVPSTGLTRLMKYSTTSPIVSTFAGTGVAGVSGGPALLATFNRPNGMAFDAEGNLFVVDQYGNDIRKITPAGVVSKFAGSGDYAYADGEGLNASFRHPCFIAIDANGNLFIGDTDNHRIRKITKGGLVSTYAGIGPEGPWITIFPYDGYRTAASIGPQSLAFDAQGTLYFNGGNLSKITSDGNVVSIGLTPSSSAGWGMAVDPVSGNFYVSNYNKILKITPTGSVTTFAGSGDAGAADGLGTAASFSQPCGLAIDADGNIYVADISNNKIRKITPQGMVSTLAGTGLAGSADGVGSSATFDGPINIVIDSKGNLLVSDQNNNRIRKITLK